MPLASPALKAKRTFSKVRDGEYAIASTRGRVRYPEFRIRVFWPLPFLLSLQPPSHLRGGYPYLTNCKNRLPER